MKEPSFIDLIDQAAEALANALGLIDQADSAVNDTEVAEAIAGSEHALIASARNLIGDSALQLKKAKEVYDDAVENKDKEPNAVDVNGNPVQA